MTGEGSEERKMGNVKKGEKGTSGYRKGKEDRKKRKVEERNTRWGGE